VGRGRDRGVEDRVGSGLAGDEAQGEDPGPDRQGVIGLVVEGGPVRTFRDLGQRQGQDGGGGQLPGVAPADLVAPPGDDVLDQRAQGDLPLAWVGVGRVRPMAMTDR
jgi:hypothetical protein